jgi:hypothetical protein
VDFQEFCLILEFNANENSIKSSHYAKIEGNFFQFIDSNANRDYQAAISSDFQAN